MNPETQLAYPQPSTPKPNPFPNRHERRRTEKMRLTQARKDAWEAGYGRPVMEASDFRKAINETKRTWFPTDRLLRNYFKALRKAWR